MGERRSVGAATIAEAFRLTVEDNADRIAVRTKDDEIAWTWTELAAKVDAFAGGLARLGVTRGDTVALMVSNRPEFMVADLAATMLGATPFSIYLTSAPDQIAYVIKDAGARVAIVEAPFKAAVAPLVEYVITVEEMDGHAVPGFAPDWRAVQPDDILTIIYTSGTTGPPKGVQLTHAQRDGGRGRGGAARRLPGRLARDLVAAERPRGRAHRPSLPADRLRHDDHDLPGPAPDRRVPAGGQADVVLRRPARVGEAQGGRGGQAGAATRTPRS